MLPLLQKKKKMHIEPKNRKDLQLVKKKKTLSSLPTLLQNVQFHSWSQATMHLVQDGAVTRGKAERLRTERVVVI